MVIAVSTHRLAAEAAVKFSSGITVGIWRGRRAADPDNPGETMCRNLAAVDEARAIKVDVETACCRRPASKNTPAVLCEFYNTCSYQRQKKTKADVWFTAHEMLWARKPHVLGEVAAIVVDENPGAAGLRSTSLAVGALTTVTPVWSRKFPIENLQMKGQPEIDLRDLLDEGAQLSGSKLHMPDLPATELLTQLRKKLLDAFDTMPDGPVTRAALKAAGVTSDVSRSAISWRRPMAVARPNIIRRWTRWRGGFVCSVARTRSSADRSVLRNRPLKIG